MKYVKHSVVPACSVRLHDRGVFTWKECKGLNRLTETELGIRKGMWLASDTRRQSIDRMRENSTDENVSVIYPAELENRARSAVIHMNAEEFTGCFQKFMK